MAPGYEREQELLKNKRETLTEEISHSEEIFNDVGKFLPIIWKYTDIQGLNAHILNELIGKIVVHEKTVNPDGSKSQRVDIHYKVIGYIDTAEMLANNRMVAPGTQKAVMEEPAEQTA